MSEDLKTLIDRLPPEMESDLREHIKFLLRTSGNRSRRKPRLLLKNLGWTQAQIQEARARLASFEGDWDYPGMEKYDDL
jgi:hypothetical protein